MTLSLHALNRNLKRFFCLIVFGLFLVALFGCQEQAPEPIYFNGATMGTTWSVTLRPGAEIADVSALKKRLQQRLDHINGLMSTYDPASEISRFNAQAGTDWFAISAETAEVIELSQQVSDLTGGAFDVTVGPLVELWGFGAAKRSEQVPTDRQVQALLDRIGNDKLRLRKNPPAIKKLDPQLRVDLSAVAKGYAVDQLAEVLSQQGISNFLVEIGGEMRLSGRRSDGSPWRIAIEKPVAGRREVETIFRLTDIGVATSGNYRNYYEVGGERYVHTLDPVSGRPILHRLASVTVLDPACARADALATALMVLGEERGRRFCEKNGIAAYFLIHEQDAIIESATPAFQDFLQKDGK